MCSCERWSPTVLGIGWCCCHTSLCALCVPQQETSHHTFSRLFQPGTASSWRTLDTWWTGATSTEAAVDSSTATTDNSPTAASAAKISESCFLPTRGSSHYHNSWPIIGCWMPPKCQQTNVTPFQCCNNSANFPRGRDLVAPAHRWCGQMLSRRLQWLHQSAQLVQSSKCVVGQRQTRGRSREWEPQSLCSNKQKEGRSLVWSEPRVALQCKFKQGTWDPEICFFSRWVSKFLYY